MPDIPPPPHLPALEFRPSQGGGRALRFSFFFEHSEKFQREQCAHMLLSSNVTTG